MATLIVYGKGDIAGAKLSQIAIPYLKKVSFKLKKPRWYQYQPRFEARFHGLTAHEIAAIKVKLAFVEGITKIELI